MGPKGPTNPAKYKILMSPLGVQIPRLQAKENSAKGTKSMSQFCSFRSRRSSTESCRLCLSSGERGTFMPHEMGMQRSHRVGSKIPAEGAV